MTSDMSLEEIKNNIINNKNELLNILNLLSKEDQNGILDVLIQVCGANSSLGVAISDLVSKVGQARSNVILELDNLINIISDSSNINN